MRPDEVERDEVAHPLIEFGRTSEIGEQKRQAGDLQTLIDIDRVGAVEVAKYLVGQQPLCGQERLAPAQKLIEPFRRDPQSGQYAGVSAVFERQAQRPRAQHDRLRRRTYLVENQREVLALARRLALDLEELGHMGHRVEKDHKFGRQLQRKQGLLAGRKLDRVESHFLDHLIEIFRQIDRRAPEYLAKVLGERKLVRIMRRDPAHPPVDRKRHLDDLVEDRRITSGAPGAVVLLAVDTPQRGARVEHAAAARAQHVPRQLEETRAARRAERRRSHFSSSRPRLRRKIQHVDPAEVAIRRIPHQLLDRIDAAGIGRLPQKRKQIFGFAHLKSYSASRAGHQQASEIVRVSCRRDAVAFTRHRHAAAHRQCKFGYELCARQLPCCHHAVSIVGR